MKCHRPCYIIMGCVIGSVLLSLLYHCDFPKNPKAPAWDTQFAIPLADYVFEFSELQKADKDSLLRIEEGIYHILYKHDIEPFDMGSKLKIAAPAPVHFSKTIGEVKLRSPGTGRSPDIPLWEVGPDAMQMHGKSYVVPGFDFSLVKDIEPFEEFRYVTIVDGYADVTLMNDMMIYLGDPVLVDVKNKVDGTLVGTVKFDEAIPPGGTATQRLELSDTVVYNELELDINGHSVGSNGEQVTVDAYSSFAVEVFLSALTVSQAEAKVPPQEFSKVGATALEESTQVFGARIKSGTVVVTIESQLPVDCEASVIIPAFTQDGVPFTQTVTLERADPQWVTEIDLTDYVLGDLTEEETPLDSLRYALEVRTIDTEEDSDPISDYAVISHTDFVTVEITFEELRFSYLKGNLLKEHQYEIPTSQHAISLKKTFKNIEGLESDWITFKQASFEISMFHNIQIPVALALRIDGVAYRQDGSVAARSSVEEEFIVTDQQSWFTIQGEELISIMPDSIRISGHTRISGRVEMDDQAKMEGTATLDAPLTVRIRESALELGKTRSQKVPKEIQDAAKRDEIRHVKVVGQIENHNPLSGWAFLLSSPNPASFDSAASPEAAAEIDTLFNQVLPQPIFDASGNIVMSDIGQVAVLLDSAKFHILRNPMLYIKPRVILDATTTEENPEGYVSIKPTQYVGIKARMEIDVRVDLDQ